VTYRIRALVAALAVVGGALTACASGPSQINSAVIIGDRVISVDDVQHRLDESLNTEPATKDLAKNRKLDLVSRGIVNQLVRHELLAEAAKREGLSVSEKDLADVTAGTAPAQDPVQRAIEAGFDAHELAKDRLLALNLGKKYASRLQLTVSGAQVVSPANAQKLATDLAKKLAAVKPDQVGAELEKLATQEINPVPNLLVSAPYSYGLWASQNQGLDIRPLFGAPVNSVVAFPLGSGEQSASSGWFVGVIQRRDENATLTDQVAQLLPQVTPDWLQGVGLKLISPLAAELGVRISPRYGIWDQLSVGVVPSEGERFGLIIPAANARP
jgi:SurA-like protein